LRGIDERDLDERESFLWSGGCQECPVSWRRSHFLRTDELLRTEHEGNFIDTFLKDVEHSQGKIVVFGTEFETGKNIDFIRPVYPL